ncbi:MAG: GNAT family N-acetyltransferase [Wujia sp.]
MEIMAVNKEDSEELLAIYAPYVRNTAVSFEYEVPSEAEFQRRIESISSRLPYLKAVKNGEIVGYAYASSFKGRRAYDWSVEVTVYIKQSERQKGVGRALIRLAEWNYALL